MTLFKEKFKIDSNRLKNWNYSNEAVYFITLVTEKRKCIFGSIEDGKMILNNNGQIIENELLKSIKIRKNWFFHNWIVMPNHIHLLIEIQNSNVPIVETQGNASNAKIEHSSVSKLSRTPNSISSFVAIFKAITTKQINSTESIWQSNFHDHIVRNYKSFEVIYDYIKNNPRSWETDSINSNL